MKTGFSTIGSPKKIGSLIWKIWLGSESRLMLLKPASRDRHSSSVSADVHERREEAVRGHVRQRQPLRHRRDVLGEILQKNRRDDRVHCVVAVDAD
jgi:hypothetical protein